VVTALHVVAGCARITVYWEKHSGVTQRAQIVRVLNGIDLALLEATGAPGKPLAADARRPRVDAQLEVLGYYLAVPTMDSKPLRVTFGSSRLRDMLPTHVRRELQQSGAIDLDMEIVRLDGHLLPGLSGAPIFDVSGKVVAIGSGGLKSGAASVSWAVPALHLEALLRSQERLGNGQGSSNLFSAPLPDDGPGCGRGQHEPSAAEQLIICGGARFIYTGVRSFEELTYGHEDLASIEYLTNESELPIEQVMAFKYHTFQPV
jgi:hypothetical protein